MRKNITVWQTKSSKVVLNHKRLIMSEDKVILPNGKTSTYLRHAQGQDSSVCIIAVNSNKEILIQKEYSYPPNKIMWQLPGGSINKNEGIKAAAKRELAEESGYSAKNSIILGYYYTHNRLSDQKQYVVLCTDLFEYKLPADDDEYIESFWLSQDKVIKKISNGEFHNINLLAALNIWFHSNKV